MPHVLALPPFLSSLSTFWTKLRTPISRGNFSGKQRLATPADIAAFAAKNGADGKRLVETMSSFAVAGKVKQATALAGGYKIEGTPSLGVDGRWLTSGPQAGSNARSMDVADHLIALAKKAR